MDIYSLTTGWEMLCCHQFKVSWQWTHTPATHAGRWVNNGRHLHWTSPFSSHQGTSTLSDGVSVKAEHMHGSEQYRPRTTLKTHPKKNSTSSPIAQLWGDYSRRKELSLCILCASAFFLSLCFYVICECTQTCRYTHPWVHTRWPEANVSLSICPLRQGLSLSLELADLLDWLAHKPQDRLSLRPQQWRHTDTTSTPALTWSRDPSSGP